MTERLLGTNPNTPNLPSRRSALQFQHLFLSDFGNQGLYMGKEHAGNRQLLERFAESRSEAAFGELVNRYVNLVYSTTGQLIPMMSEQDWTIYHDRWLMFGEQNAENWVIGKYGQH
jgi:hypothetical protein